MSRLLCLILLVLPFASAHAVEVLASIRPLALIAQAVVGETVVVQQLVPTGTSAHDYQLRPSDRLRLARADVLLWTGPAHEGFLERATQASKARVLTAQTLPGIRLRAHRRLDGGSVIPRSVDPHLWLDPDNAVVIARALADELAQRDAGHAMRYRKNAADFATRIAALKAKQAPRFQGLPSRSFIAYHDAYQYLEPMLGLRYRGALVVAGEGKSSARHFLHLSQKIRQEGISCLLGEPGFDEALARNVFAGSTAELVSVDEQFAAVALSAVGYESGLALMADGIYRCLGGAAK
jgi:zinc transport system substrate-binding protein